MAEFSELTRSFEKIRDYMRDFYVYGFKSRTDFHQRSARTYDNERRRIESYLGGSMRFMYGSGGKRVFVSVDASRIPENPLYNAWKSKSFTDNDVLLHFLLLDCLLKGALALEPLCDMVCTRGGQVFDIQTVRNKCNEYVREGLLRSEKQGKKLVYTISPMTIHSLMPDSAPLLDAIAFFQGAAPFGEIGSFLMDNAGLHNELFSYKHHYIVHTLESGVLLDMLKAIRENRAVSFDSRSERTGRLSTIQAVPLSIFVSCVTGRRYVCTYHLTRKRFLCFRLDYVLTVRLLDPYPEADALKLKLNENIDKIWGVSFGGASHGDTLDMTLRIDRRTESYVFDRLVREGRGGTAEWLDGQTARYTKTAFDVCEASPWVKTFCGRILSLKSTNTEVVRRFHDDMARMAAMYAEE
jgi:hypothetical protein